MLARITSSSPDLDVTGDLDATSSSLQSTPKPYTQFDYCFGPKQANHTNSTSFLTILFILCEEPRAFTIEMWTLKVHD